jgi:hypothetical protein
MGDVRASAKIDERTASVDSAHSAVGNTLVDEVLLVLAVVEHFKELFLGHFKTLKGLLLLDDGVGQSLQRLLVLLLNDLSKEKRSATCSLSGTQDSLPFHVGHIVVESGRVGGRGTVAEVAAESLLSSLTENVG